MRTLRTPLLVGGTAALAAVTCMVVVLGPRQRDGGWSVQPEGDRGASRPGTSAGALLASDRDHGGANAQAGGARAQAGRARTLAAAGALRSDHPELVLGLGGTTFSDPDAYSDELKIALLTAGYSSGSGSSGGGSGTGVGGTPVPSPSPVDDTESQLISTAWGLDRLGIAYTAADLGELVDRYGFGTSRLLSMLEDLSAYRPFTIEEIFTMMATGRTSSWNFEELEDFLVAMRVTDEAEEPDGPPPTITPFTSDGATYRVEACRLLTTWFEFTDDPIVTDAGSSISFATSYLAGDAFTASWTPPAGRAARPATLVYSFGTSATAGVGLTMLRAAVQIEWDEGLLPRGEWKLDVSFADESGNRAYSSQTFEVDYPDDVTPPTVEFYGELAVYDEGCGFYGVVAPVVASLETGGVETPLALPEPETGSAMQGLEFEGLSVPPTDEVQLLHVTATDRLGNWIRKTFRIDPSGSVTVVEETGGADPGGTGPGGTDVLGVVDPLEPDPLVAPLPLFAVANAPQTFEPTSSGWAAHAFAGRLSATLDTLEGLVASPPDPAGVGPAASGSDPAWATTTAAHELEILTTVNQAYRLELLLRSDQLPGEFEGWLRSDTQQGGFKTWISESVDALSSGEVLANGFGQLRFDSQVGLTKEACLEQVLELARRLEFPDGVLPPTAEAFRTGGRTYESDLVRRGWRFSIHGDRVSPVEGAPLQEVIDFGTPQATILLEKIGGARDSDADTTRWLRTFDVANYRADLVRHAWIGATKFPDGRVYVIDPWKGVVRELEQAVYAYPDGNLLNPKLVTPQDWNGNWCNQITIYTIGQDGARASIDGSEVLIGPGDGAFSSFEYYSAVRFGLITR